MKRLHYFEIRTDEEGTRRELDASVNGTPLHRKLSRENQIAGSLFSGNRRGF